MSSRATPSPYKDDDPAEMSDAAESSPLSQQQMQQGQSTPQLSGQRSAGGGDDGEDVRTTARGAVRNSAARSEAASMMADEFKQGLGLHDDDDDDDDDYQGVEENAAPLRMDSEAEVSFGQ